MEEHYNGKQKILLLITILIFFVALDLTKSSTNPISCEVATNCTGTTAFKISSLVNAHAELQNLSNYIHSVCCRGVFYILGNSCAGGINLLGLSSTTNAHVEKNTYSNYGTKVCLSSPPDINLSCIYTTQNCGDVEYDTCLATISADTNAHVGDCVSDPYPTKICCKSECVAESETECGTPCEPDCTFVDDNRVHAYCDTQNGCAFYDNVSRAVCDNSQPGWVRDYNESHYVVCAPGAPQPKVEIRSSINCESGTLVKVTKIVLYNGRPVKLVVAACG